MNSMIGYKLLDKHKKGINTDLHKSIIFKQIWRYRYFYIFILPAIIWFFIFKYIPMYGIILGFKEYRFDKGILGSDWVGLRYVKQFINHYDFWMLIRNTLSISALKLFVGFPMPIILALMLNEVNNNTFKRIIQTVSYLPHFISWVVVVALMTKFLSPYGGLINEVLGNLFGIKPINFMGEKEYFYPLVVISSIWKEVGWGSIVYLAAITGINQDIYEAAALDGAGKMKCILHITIPCILPTAGIMFIMKVGTLIEAGFDQIYLMQTPGVLDVAEVLDTYVVKTGIREGMFSFATVVGLFQSVVSLFLIAVTNTVSRKLSDVALW
jgi:putative aldouronate transport system permease protein